MCGLSGFYGVKLPEAAKEAAIDLMFMNMERGPDSTGAVTVSSDGSLVSAYRQLETPDHVMKTEFDNMLDEPLMSIMTHNRKATKGDVNEFNIHPFSHKHIIGMHNGTLYNTDDLDDEKIVGTDSEALIRTIANRGIIEAYSLMRGAATIVWFDKESKAINLITNGQRPLHILVFQKRRLMAWSSEAFPLAMVHRKHFPKDDVELFKVKDHLKISWRVEGKKLVFSKLECKPYSYSSYQNRNQNGGQGQNQGGFRKYGNWFRGAREEKNQTPEQKAAKAAIEYKGRQVYQVNRKMKDGNYINRKDFISDPNLSSCCICETPLNFDDDDVEIISKEAACCGNICLSSFRHAFPYVGFEGDDDFNYSHAF